MVRDRETGQRGTSTGDVAVVIPCYNAERWIAATVESALAQGASAALAQVIVVDDGSSDASTEVLESFGDRISWTTGPNRGACHARNTGLAMTDATYVAFLDADDLYDGPILAGAVAAAKAASADLVFSRMEIRRDGQTLEVKGPLGPPEEDAETVFANWFDGGWVNPSATLWRAGFLRGVGSWDESVGVGDDGEVVLRALLAGARVARNEQGRGIYNRGIEGSLSLSGGVTRRKLAELIEVVARTCARARELGWGHRLGRSYAALYFLARMAFLNGHRDVGRAALAELRRVGHKRHHGSLAHRISASLLGLETKTVFAQQLSGWLSQLRGKQ